MSAEVTLCQISNQPMMKWVDFWYLTPKGELLSTYRLIQTTKSMTWWLDLLQNIRIPHASFKIAAQYKPSHKLGGGSGLSSEHNQNKNHETPLGS